MINPIEFDPNTFDLEDSEDVIGLAKSLVNGRHPGLLATVDAAGRPQVRWMSSLAFDEFPVFHTLTAPGSRKLGQIRMNPAVHWMFFNQDLTLILNLRGRARIVEDAATLKRIWQKIVDMSHVYFLEYYRKKPGFVAIETTVESIELSSPARGLRVEIKPGELAHAS